MYIQYWSSTNKTLAGWLNAKSYFLHFNSFHCSNAFKPLSLQSELQTFPWLTCKQTRQLQLTKDMAANFWCWAYISNWYGSLEEHDHIYTTQLITSWLNSVNHWWAYRIKVKQNTPFESRIPALLFNPTRIRFKLPAQPRGGWVLLCDLYAFDIQIRSVINSYLCHLSLNAVALEGSHGLLSCSRAVEIHETITWGGTRHSQW